MLAVPRQSIVFRGPRFSVLIGILTRHAAAVSAMLQKYLRGCMVGTYVGAFDPASMLAVLMWVMRALS